MLREQHFDLVLLDISLPDKHGMDVLKQIMSVMFGEFTFDVKLSWLSLVDLISALPGKKGNQ